MTDEPVKKSILIVGAGAIGRGFLAPRLVEAGYDVCFADRDPSLIREFDRDDKIFKTVTVLEDGYDLLEAPYTACLHINDIGQLIDQTDCVVFAVDERDLKDAAGEIRRLLRPDSNALAVLNIYSNPEIQTYLETLFQQRAEVQPITVDCLVSPKAPSELMHIDPLCVTAASGTLILPGEGNQYNIPLCIRGMKAEEIWRLQQFLDLSAQLSLSYLGVHKGYQYLHEVAVDSEVYLKVLHLIRQIRDILDKMGMCSDKSMNEYIKICLNRIRNNRLRLPLEHSGKHPINYLEAGGLLQQIYQIFKDQGHPTDGITEIMLHAFLYPYCPFLQRKRELLDPTQLIEDVCGPNLPTELMHHLLDGLQGYEKGSLDR
ncbi:2-dehydropantoate 2-reductase N-terminal domain-containing protein [Sneathiella limimaris]|uniref:2-dehydropantoate 2-reductase N-terminal domain-containing protein n=1 Tax=Sneathiella limimaris TaxID=1964213 RepID=UPI00146ED6B9|nr:2-dehydropantoate 2-reductase N-terminal domain-containing protein [Sneathiella limimaris]